MTDQPKSAVQYMHDAMKRRGITFEDLAQRVSTNEKMFEDDAAALVASFKAGNAPHRHVCFALLNITAEKRLDK